jgi:hypothetical protein
MYFIFKHTKFSRYKDVKGKVYNFDKKSPNWEKVKVGSKVLLYDKESNEIFGSAAISKLKIVNENEFYAYYKNYVHFKRPIELTKGIRKKFKIRNLELPSPGIIPIAKEVYEELVNLSKIYTHSSQTASSRRAHRPRDLAIQKLK